MSPQYSTLRAWWTTQFSLLSIWVVCPFWKEYPSTSLLHIQVLSVSYSGSAVPWRSLPQNSKGIQNSSDIFSTSFLIITYHFLFNSCCHFLWEFWYFQTLKTFLCVPLWMWFMGGAISWNSSVIKNLTPTNHS